MPLAPNSVYNLEGPILTPLVIVLFCAAWGFVFWQRQRYALTTPPSSGISYKLPTRFYGILGAILLYLLSSHYVDFSNSSQQLMSHALLSWGMFSLVLWAFYDGCCILLKKLNLNIHTPYFGLNIALTLFIGSRLLAFFSTLSGLFGIGLRFTFFTVFFASVFWALFRSASFISKTPHMSIKALIKRNIQPALPYLIVALLVVLVGWLNSHRLMSSWDNYIHWLIVPHEMLNYNLAAGLYEYTNSVSPGYPPQQSTDGAFLLFLWGNANYSDTVLNWYNIIHLGVGLLLCIDIFKKINSRSFYVLCAILFAVFVVSQLENIYHLSFYGDSRAALALLVSIAPLILLDTQTQREKYVILAITASCVFTAKPYLWPFVIVPGLVLFLSYRDIKNFAFYIVPILAIFSLEIFLFLNLAPESQFRITGLLGQKTSTLTNLFTLDIEKIIRGFQRQSASKYAVLILVSLCSTNAVLAYRSKSRERKEFLVASIFVMAGLLILLALLLQTKFNLSHSLPRYMQNLSLIGICSVGVLLAGITKLNVSASRAIFALICGLCVYGALHSPRFESHKWVFVRHKNLQLFPQDPYLGNLLATSLPSAEDRDGKPIRILILSEQRTPTEHHYNYMLSRAVQKSTAIHRRKIASTVEMVDREGLGNIEAWLLDKKITHIYVTAPLSVLSTQFDTSVLSTQDFVSALMEP